MEIVPYESVGPVRFGMSRDDVKGVLGTPVAIGFGDTRFVYEHLVIDFDDHGAAEITVDTPQAVQILGRTVLNDVDGWETLLGMSKERFRGDGSLVLMDIGVSITDDPESPGPMTAFVQGKMDPFVMRYERI
jgi:hypothetical protein